MNRASDTASSRPLKASCSVIYSCYVVTVAYSFVAKTCGDLRVLNPPPPFPNPAFPKQVKAAFTRAYNKEAHLTPYSLQAVKKGRRGAVDTDLALDPDSDLQGQEEEEEEETLNTDAMVKVNTKTSL